jgi:hypothetical protein
MNNQQINNAKTKEDAKENSVAGLISASLAYGISEATGMDDSTRGVMMPIITAGIMGVLKTMIRRIRNRIKHRRMEKEDG